MSNTFNLRDRIEEQRRYYIDETGKPTRYWTEEGIPWAIQDYHSSRGSVMDFTENDWRVCKENGWSLHEVCTLCHEEHFSPEVNNLEDFLHLYRQAWKESGDNPMTGDDLADAVESYFTWREELLPKMQKIYSNG